MLFVANINNQDIYGEFDPNFKEYKAFAERAVREAKFTARRDIPLEQQEVKVEVYRVTTSRNQLVRVLAATFNVVPPLAPLNQEEYEVEEKHVLESIPVELHEAFRIYASDGISFEERLFRLNDLVGLFREPLKELIKR